MNPESIVLEIGERMYLVEVRDYQVAFAPCEFVTWNAVRWDVANLQTIDIRPDAAGFFFPIDVHANDLKALLMGHILR